MIVPADHAPPPRRGTILIVALTVMSILMVLAAAMLRGTQLSRRQFRSELHLRQIDQLLDAAIATAAARLAAGEPATESRTIPAAEIVGRHAAGLTITTGPAEASGRLIEAVVEYPLGGLHPIRRRRVRRIELANPPPSSAALPPSQINPQESRP